MDSSLRQILWLFSVDLPTLGSHTPDIFTGDWRNTQITKAQKHPHTLLGDKDCGSTSWIAGKLCVLLR